jgi:hypothetical protein
MKDAKSSVQFFPAVWNVLLNIDTFQFDTVSFMAQGSRGRGWMDQEIPYLTFTEIHQTPSSPEIGFTGDTVQKSTGL